MKKTFAVLSALALSSVALVGCSSESAPAAECLTVDDVMMQAIAEGSNDYKMIPTKAAAVQSGDYYYIAMDYKTETLSGKPVSDSDKAIWASTAIDATGSIQSVDNMASGFTAWPENVWGLSHTDPEAVQAKKCLK